MFFYTLVMASSNFCGALFYIICAFLLGGDGHKTPRIGRAPLEPGFGLTQKRKHVYIYNVYICIYIYDIYIYI